MPVCDRVCQSLRNFVANRLSNLSNYSKGTFDLDNSTGGLALQGRNVIQISADKLQEIEYLLSQSIQGVHLLFKNNVVARILKTPTEDIDFFNFDNIKRVQNILSDFISQKTLHEKQKFLHKLDDESYELLVRTYFNIVDNAVLESTEFKH